MKTILALFFTVFFYITISAQVGIGTTDPDASAVLELESESQGMLTPRMETAQRTAIVSPAQGLLVYDTDVNSFYFYNGGE